MSTNQDDGSKVQVCQVGTFPNPNYKEPTGPTTDGAMPDPPFGYSYGNPQLRCGDDRYRRREFEIMIDNPEYDRGLKGRHKDHGGFSAWCQWRFHIAQVDTKGRLWLLNRRWLGWIPQGWEVLDVSSMDFKDVGDVELCEMKTPEKIDAEKQRILRAFDNPSSFFLAISHRRGFDVLEYDSDQGCWINRFSWKRLKAEDRVDYLYWGDHNLLKYSVNGTPCTARRVPTRWYDFTSAKYKWVTTTGTEHCPPARPAKQK